MRKLVILQLGRMTFTKNYKNFTVIFNNINKER